MEDYGLLAWLGGAQRAALIGQAIQSRTGWPSSPAVEAAQQGVNVTVDAAGLEALRRMWERHKRIGQWGFDGPGLADVELAIELHEQLVRLSTPLELQQTMRRVIAARDAAELKS